MSGDSFVSWLPQYSLNIEAIDQQHQVLVTLLRQLQEAMWEGRGQAFQKTLLRQLVDYTRVHFSFEEEMLREAGYESLAEHIEQHSLLTGQVVELLQRIQDGHVISNTTLMLMLRHWLTDHILKDDRKYARALKRID